MSRSRDRRFCSYDQSVIWEYERTGLIEMVTDPGQSPEEMAQISSRRYHQTRNGTLWGRPTARFRRYIRRQDKARQKQELISSVRSEDDMVWGFTQVPKRRVGWEWY